MKLGSFAVTAVVLAMAATITRATTLAYVDKAIGRSTWRVRVKPLV